MMLGRKLKNEVAVFLLKITSRVGKRKRKANVLPPVKGVALAIISRRVPIRPDRVALNISYLVIRGVSMHRLREA